MFIDDFNLYDISGLGSNSLKEGEDKYETLPNQKNDNKDERIYYNFCYEGVRDEIGEDNTATSVYTLLILTKEIKGVNGKTKMAIKQCFI